MRIIAKFKMKKYFKYFLYFRTKLYVEMQVGRSMYLKELDEYRIVKFGFNKSRMKVYPKLVFGILKDKHKALGIYNTTTEKDIKKLAQLRCLGLDDIENIKTYGE